MGGRLGGDRNVQHVQKTAHATSVSDQPKLSHNLSYDEPNPG